VNSARDAGEQGRAAQLAAELRALGGVLGLLKVEPAQWFRLAKPPAGTAEGGAGLSDAQIEARIAARAAARRREELGRIGSYPRGACHGRRTARG